MSHHFKKKPRLAGNPLPQRNRKAVLAQRIAARIESPDMLNSFLSTQPAALRAGYVDILRPHLKFEVVD
jgi:hypothetical protein